MKRKTLIPNTLIFFVTNFLKIIFVATPKMAEDIGDAININIHIDVHINIDISINAVINTDGYHDKYYCQY